MDEYYQIKFIRMFGKRYPELEPTENPSEFFQKLDDYGKYEFLSICEFEDNADEYILNVLLGTKDAETIYKYAIDEGFIKEQFILDKLTEYENNQNEIEDILEKYCFYSNEVKSQTNQSEIKRIISEIENVELKEFFEERYDNIVVLFPKENEYGRKQLLKSCSSESVKAEALIKIYKDDIPQQYTEYIYSTYIRDVLKDLNKDNLEESIEKIKQYERITNEIDTIENREQKNKIIENVSSEEMKKCLKRKYMPLTTEEFQDCIDCIIDISKEACIENSYDQSISSEQLKNFFQIEFEKELEFEKDESSSNYRYRESDIGRSEIIINALKSNLEKMNQNEIVEFCMDLFKEKDSNICRYENIYNGIINQLKEIDNMELVCKLISQIEEYQFKERHIEKQIKNDIVKVIPILETSKEEVERLSEIEDTNLKKYFWLRTSDKGKTEYIISTPDIDVLEYSKSIRDTENIKKILDFVEDDNTKTKLIIQYASQYVKRDEIIGELSPNIPILDNPDEELERLFKTDDIEELKILISRSSSGILYNYLHEKPEKASLISGINELKECMELIPNDIIKTKILMTVSCDFEIKKQFYKYINDDFCKSLISLELDHPNNEENLKEKFDKLDLYSQINKEVMMSRSEDSKTEIIRSIDDNDMKLSFMKQIKEESNRNRIISSLTRNVDDNIRELDQLARDMIMVFFEDFFDGDIPQDKKERLMIAMNRTSVGFENLRKPTNGRAYHLESRIGIANRNFKNDNINIGFLIHEYAHVLSLSNFKTAPSNNNSFYEEGNADLFSDLVINHYLEKHPDKEDLWFEIDTPYQVNSAYDSQNDWTRTFLYPLENEGKDLTAIIEYSLGSKEKYFEMVLSPEFVDGVGYDSFGNMNSIDVSVDLLHSIHQGKYLNLNPNSIYAKRNTIIQKLIEKDKILYKDNYLKSLQQTYKNVDTYEQELENSVKAVKELQKEEKYAAIEEI